LATGATLPEACDQIAAFDPEGANAALQVGLKAWTGGALDLSNRPWVKALPPNFRLWADVDLRGTGIERLPRGLKVGGTLAVGGPAWDGLVPKGTHATRIVTETFHRGGPLDMWREDFPDGEPTPVNLGNRLAGLVAAGMDRWDAKLALVEAGLAPELFPEFAALPKSFLASNRSWTPEQALLAFAGIAQADPEGANLAWNAWLEGRTVAGDLTLAPAPDWITSLPEGLVIGGSLDVRGSRLTALPRGLVVEGGLNAWNTPVGSLPDGLRVGGMLELRCTPITTLPQRLRVGGRLALTGCDHWDQCLPKDTEVGGLLLTDRHLHGIDVDAWRQQHPQGEGR
jgi:hypothetical protein